MIFYDESSKIHLLGVIFTILYDDWYDKPHSVNKTVFKTTSHVLVRQILADGEFEKNQGVK
jgi:hypothetical protein